MKFVLSLIALCAIQTSYAQKVIKNSFPGNEVTEIRVDTEYADIEIESYNGSEISIEASVNINLNMDNDGYALEADNRGSTLFISSELDTENIPKRIIIKDKEGNTTVIKDGENAMSNIDSNNDNYTSINYGYQTDITLKIKIPKNKDINIESIYGDLLVSGKYNDLKANITYGDIEIIQSSISPDATIELNSTYGHVDYSLPKTANIEFNLSISYGEIFTDLDVISSKDNVFLSNSCNNSKGGQYTLNDGGSIANITATYADIYLRGN